MPTALGFDTHQRHKQREQDKSHLRSRAEHSAENARRTKQSCGRETRREGSSEAVIDTHGA